MVPQSVVCETMFMRLNDIIAYCKTLVRSGILQSDSASQLPMNPLEIRDLFGLIIRVDSDGLTMRDIEGQIICIAVANSHYEAGDIVVIKEVLLDYDKKGGFPALPKDSELEIDRIRISC